MVSEERRSSEDSIDIKIFVENSGFIGLITMHNTDISPRFQRCTEHRGRVGFAMEHSWRSRTTTCKQSHV